MKKKKKRKGEKSHLVTLFHTSSREGYRKRKELARIRWEALSLLG